MAADPDPYYALPRLYGAPAYSRAPKVIPESERPFDPDDLPIAAEQTDDERAVIAPSRAIAQWRSNGGPDGAASTLSARSGADAPNGGSPSAGGRRLSLRTLAERLGARSR